ncbi:hypothetical protein NDN13_06750 [Acinetobacter sp. C32I]|uniref:hypothetical protein n=1 Tax=Acinetobacter sp. C32I TaxID=2950074 RepID=UPI0020373861|nr:hypothetical protein [Acinetobacter sp. C32I]USA54875.1 hypothetical protein NDN13_06750 [Acinetobacter sp. C32I]
MIQANYQGVIIPYRNYIGKKFNEIEEKIELNQKQNTGVEPVDTDITIQFNSTYLEVLDKAYSWRGVINFFSIGLCIFALFMINLMILIILKVGFDWLAIAAFLLMSLFLLGIFFIYKFF